jgi:hypothetical protein
MHCTKFLKRWEEWRNASRQTPVGGKIDNKVNILFFCAEQILNYPAK